MDFRDNTAVGMTPYMEFHMPRSVGFFFKMGPPGVGKVRGNVAKSTGTGVWSMHSPTTPQG